MSSQTATENILFDEYNLNQLIADPDRQTHCHPYISVYLVWGLFLSRDSKRYVYVLGKVYFLMWRNDKAIRSL